MRSEEDPRDQLVGWLSDVDGFWCVLDELLAWGRGEASLWLRPAELHRCGESIAERRLADAMADLALAADRLSRKDRPDPHANWTDPLVEGLLDDVAELDRWPDLWASAVDQRLASIAWSEGRRVEAYRLVASALGRRRARSIVPLEDAA